MKRCVANVELVTDELERAVAKVQLDQAGFDVFKDEVGSSRDASLKRNGAPLSSVPFEDRDILKVTVSCNVG